MSGHFKGKYFILGVIISVCNYFLVVAGAMEFCKYLNSFDYFKLSDVVSDGMSNAAALLMVAYPHFPTVLAAIKKAEESER